MLQWNCAFVDDGRVLARCRVRALSYERALNLSEQWFQAHGFVAGFVTVVRLDEPFVVHRVGKEGFSWVM